MSILVFWGTVLTIAAATANVTIWLQWRKWKRDWTWLARERDKMWDDRRDTWQTAYRCGLLKAQVLFDRQYKRAVRDEEKQKDSWRVRMIAARDSIEDAVNPLQEGEERS